MRYLIAGGIVLVAIGVLAAIKGSQIAALIGFGQEAEQAGPPPEAVGAATAREQAWTETLSAVGTVTSGRDVTIRTEVPGIVTRLGFDSGDRVREGQVLVELDSRIERAELAASIATARLAEATVTRTRELQARGAVSAQELDQDEAELEAARARVAALRATIAQKIIRAPFTGRAGIRAVNLGQHVEAGATITAIGAGNAALVDFTLPQDDLGVIEPGMPVRVHFGEHVFEGEIAALEPAIEQSTRALGLRAEVEGDDGGVLRPGMFVDVEVVLPQRTNVVVVPQTAVSRAPYGDSVFVLEDRPERAPGPERTPDGRPIFVARQSFVRTGEARGDFIVVLEGLRAGQEVVTAGVFKLRNGAPVYVSEEGVPQASLDPRPESR